jgi:hypothetical protein
MPKARAIHIGLNIVDPAAYGGWDGRLTACEADAADMQAIATAAGISSSKKLLSKEAKREAVLAELRSAARELVAGDLLLLTYSGHGGQVPDRNHDEDDFLDETWCFYDGQLLDDELFAEWSKFAKDVRILVLSDSCHSGTVVRVSPTSPATHSAPIDAAAGVPRAMPQEFVGRAYRARRELYDGLQKTPPKREGDIQASVLLISGCQDPQTSMDGPFNGAFTGALLRVWNEGQFKGTYRTFHRRIQRLLPLTQQPNLLVIGEGKTFVTQKPFQV